MRLPSNIRTLVLVFITLTALLLLASSLSALTFSEGKGLPITVMTPAYGQTSETSGFFDRFLAIFRIIMIIAWVLLPIYVIYLFISKEARKRLIRDLAFVLPILVLLYFLSNRVARNAGEQDLAGRFGLQSAEQLANQPAPPLPEFQPPPAWVTTIATLVLATVTVVVIVVVILAVWRRTHRKEEVPLYRIELEAQEAIDTLSAGGDLREVIQRCYQQMITALREYRLINRDEDMTPHEFGQLLVRRGLPAEPVNRLTELFEQVRYGSHNPGRAEEQMAISSLSAIVSACKQSAKKSRK